MRAELRARARDFNRAMDYADFDDRWLTPDGEDVFLFHLAQNQALDAGTLKGIDRLFWSRPNRNPLPRTSVARLFTHPIPTPDDPPELIL